jgi:hypothetical protein
MILGMTPLTFLHVVISLLGILSGIAVMWGLVTAQRLDGWTATFLATTVATSVTGFIFFPFNGVTPGIVIGIISLVVLAVAIVARYRFRLVGSWRWIYVVTAVTALYFNVFVLIVQSFIKVPALHDLAPTQSEPPFGIAQVLCLALFIAIGIAAVRRFRAGPAKAA